MSKYCELYGRYDHKECKHCLPDDIILDLSSGQIEKITPEEWHRRMDKIWADMHCEHKKKDRTGWRCKDCGTKL